MLCLGNLARLLEARWWLYRELRHRTLVAKERKEGVQANKKASSDSGNNKAKDHPDVLFAVKGIR